MRPHYAGPVPHLRQAAQVAQIHDPPQLVEVTKPPQRHRTVEGGRGGAPLLLVLRTNAYAARPTA